MDKNIWSFFRKSRISFNELVEDTFNYLAGRYEQIQSIFTPASPFGQIIEIMTAHFQLLMYYIEDAWVESNKFTASRKQSKFGLSRFVGHNPFRGKTAEGEVTIQTLYSQTYNNSDFVIIKNYFKLIFYY